MFNQEYWYIKADYGGKMIVMGAYNSENEANQAGYEKLDGDFDVIPLRTRDLGRATRMLKHNALSGGEIDTVLQRSRHIPPC